MTRTPSILLAVLLALVLAFALGERVGSRDSGSPCVISWTQDGYRLCRMTERAASLESRR